MVERFGRYLCTLQAGIHLLIPVVDRVAYVHSLKEEAIGVPSQTAVTADNVNITIDGVLYIRITDAQKASYGVEDVRWAVVQLAQTTMRSELGKLSLDRTFSERATLNERIVGAINAATLDWGLECMRYEIRDISPPANVRVAMELQAEAERRKRASVLESEGERQSAINVAEGQKQKLILTSEAARQDAINRADGDAAAILARADATAQGIRMVAKATTVPGADQAATIKLTEQYLTSFGNIAKEGNTVLLPAAMNDPASMVSQAMAIYGAVNGQVAPGSAVGTSAGARASATEAAAAEEKKAAPPAAKPAPPRKGRPAPPPPEPIGQQAGAPFSLQ